MGQKTKLGKNRLDKFYHLAKEQGYRSRAAFKLIQLNRKYNLLPNCHALLDLCAAPGGWLQVAAKTMPMSSIIIGVDLVPIKPVRGVKTLVADITTQTCRNMIKKEAGGNLFDCVVHDGAPNVGGAWSNEAYTQSALVLDSLKLATEFLAPKGSFITKVFRSKDYTALLYAFNQLFDKVEATKPTASRNTSAEIFVVCMGYKAPAKIDPRLLDPRVLFQEVAEPKKIMGPEALLRLKVKQKRQREGYDEGLSTSHKVASALSFIISDTPVEMLGQFTKLALDGGDSWQAEGVDNAKELAEIIRRHPLSGAEVRALCGDLQVLGRTEFKQLLKWRLALRKELKGELPKGEEEEEEGGKKGAKGKKKEGGEEDEPEEEEDEETKMLREMQTLKEKVERDAKKERKKRLESKRKARVRAAQMANAESPGLEQADGLFSLATIKANKDGLGGVLDTTAPGEEDMAELEAGSSDEEGASESEELDSEDAALRYEAEMEDALEDSYKSYLERRGVRESLLKEKRRRLGMDGELDGEEEGGDEGTPSDAEEDDAEEEAGAGLLVSLDEDRVGVPASGAAMAAQWFKQDVFDDPNLVVDSDDEQQGAKRKAGKGAVAAAAAAGKKGGKKAAAAEEAAEDSEEADSGDEEPARKPTLKAGNAKESSGFEEVPMEKSDSGSGSETDSDDEFDMLDDQGKAEVLALAKKMLRRKDKESIVNAAYSRYAFHDDHLPRWFVEDERRHLRPILPVTKQEVEEEKARLRAIDARPIKKVVEAKARKARKVMTKLKQAREKANAIADQEDVPLKSKMREIEKLYARAQSTSKKIKKGKKGGKKVAMDDRMKKERRADKAAIKRVGGKKKAAKLGIRGTGAAKRGGRGGKR